MSNRNYRAKVFHYEHDCGWVYGDYHKVYDGNFYHCIATLPDWGDELYQTRHHNVVEETVTQSTGLKDKTGKEIFEGDIVKHKFRRIWQTKEHTSTVIWCQEYCCYYLYDGICNHRMRDDMVYEVIGNFFDNHDLSKGWYELVKKQNYVSPPLNNSANDLPF